MVFSLRAGEELNEKPAIEVDWIWALARIHVGLRRWRKHVKEVLHARHRSLRRGNATGSEVESDQKVIRTLMSSLGFGA